MKNQNGEKSDQEFMQWLYQEFEPILYQTTRKFITDPYTCEVVVQDSLLKLISRAKQLKQLTKAALCTYIVTTVKHRAIDQLRREGRESKLHFDSDEELLLEIPDTTPAPEDLICMTERQQALRRAWEKLSPGDQLLLEGKYFKNRSDSELAEVFQCQPASIRMKLTRARKSLLCLIQKEENSYEKS